MRMQPRVALVCGLLLVLVARPAAIAAPTNGAVIFIAGDESGSVDSFNRTGMLLNTFNGDFTENDGFAVGDVNGDGLEEILIAGDETHIVDVFSQTGSKLGSFNGDFTEHDGFALGDLDGDGVAEILVAGDESHIVDIFDAAGNKVASFDAAFTANDGFATGDVDGDGSDEILVAGDETHIVDIFDGSGAHIDSFNADFTEDDGFASGDVDGDGDDEILVAGDETHSVDIFDGSGAPLTSFDGDFTIHDGFAVERRVLPDSDGDGLLDTWELNGVNGVDLPGFGADPMHKDLFLQLDVVAGETLRRAAIQAMKATFAAAPIDAGGIANPDGQPGINLWVDTGALSDPTASEGGAGPNTCGDGLDNDGDGDTDGNDSDCLVGDNLGGGGNSLTRPVQCLDATFYAAKSSFFSASRAALFRYAVSGNPLDNFDPAESEGGAGPNTCSDAVDNEGDGNTDAADTDCRCGGGLGELGGNDFIDFNHDGGSIMHELGHTLDLDHGGNVETNCKPNYVSVMNYDNQFNISQAGGTAIIDYSPPRFTGGRGQAPLPTLAESNLSESMILDATDPTNFFRFTNLAGVKVQSPLNQQVDWNGNGSNNDAGAVAANIDTGGFTAAAREGIGPTNSCSDGMDNDSDGQIDAADSDCFLPRACAANVSSADVLGGFDDWSNIALNFRPFGNTANAALHPVDGPEPTLQELEDLERAFNTTDLEMAKSDAPDPVEVGAVLTYSLTATNRGPNPASLVHVVDVLPDGVALLEAPAACDKGPAGSVACDFGELLLGEAHAFELRVDTSDVCVNGLPPAALINTATASNAAPLAGPDPDPSNDVGSVSTIPIDTTPPPIESLSVAPSSLWPPNHKLVTVAVDAVATDICDDAVVCKVVAVSSNEAVDGGGDGSTAPDWLLPGGLIAQLRAERSGSGSGRIYTVTVACSDASMNVATGTVEVRVAHD